MEVSRSGSIFFRCPDGTVLGHCCFRYKLMIIYTAEDIDSEIGIVGRNITNLRLADDIGRAGTRSPS